MLASFWEVRPSIASTALTREHVGHRTCMQHATCDMRHATWYRRATCNSLDRIHARARSGFRRVSARSCSTMLHVFRCGGCTSGLHEARVALRILSVALCNVLKCCASRPAATRRGTSSRSCTTGRCAPAAPAAPQTTPKPRRASRSAYSDSQGTRRYYRVPCAGLAGSVRQSNPSARCMLHLVLRVACCISCCALHVASRAARCTLHLVLRVACCIL